MALRTTTAGYSNNTGRSGTGPAPKLAFAGLNVLLAHPPIKEAAFGRLHKGGARPSAARPPLWNPLWVAVRRLGRQQAHQNIESGKGKLWGWTGAAQFRLIPFNSAQFSFTQLNSAQLLLIPFHSDQFSTIPLNSAQFQVLTHYCNS